MPVFVLTTNLGADKIPSHFSEKLTNVISKALKKPASYVVVQINPGANLCFGGDGQTPAGNCRLSSIGSISSQQNKESSEKIMDFIEKEIGISPERMYIEFVDLNAGNVGWSRSTF